MILKNLTVFMVISLSVFASSAVASSRVTVDGTTYRCDNSCNVDTSTNPATVTDCCGGDVWKRVVPPHDEAPIEP